MGISLDMIDSKTGKKDWKHFSSNTSGLRDAIWSYNNALKYDWSAKLRLGWTPITAEDIAAVEAEKDAKARAKVCMATIRRLKAADEAREKEHIALCNAQATVRMIGELGELRNKIMSAIELSLDLPGLTKEQDRLLNDAINGLFDGKHRASHNRSRRSLISIQARRTAGQPTPAPTVKEALNPPT
ncbi:hypothetical protein E0J20_09435 [Rhizobium leguminosarum bv. viciae]|nr:hypothetical protein E0J20_09435 [Rhizobium leguminosarum bv. viciae]